MRVLTERTRTGVGTSGIWRIRRTDGSYPSVVSHSSILPNLENMVSVAIVRPVDVVSRMTEAGIHHEIHSTLSVIQGYFDLLVEDENVSMSPKLEN